MSVHNHAISCNFCKLGDEYFMKSYELCKVAIKIVERLAFNFFCKQS